MVAMRTRALIGGTLVLALIASVCSSGGTSYGATKSGSASLGTVRKAAGAPLTVGYMTTGQTQTVDNTNEVTIARATVKYANQYLGGVAGRPLALKVCADQGTPSGATDCANQFLAAKVPVVLASEPTNPSAALAVLSPAKVPYVLLTTGDSTTLTAPDASSVANPLIILTAPIALAKASGAKHVAMIRVDLPAADSLPALAAPMYKKAGLKLTTTAVPLGSPDVTPQVQAALSGGADQFLVIGDESLCVNTLKALKTLGYRGKVTSNFNCLTGSTAGSVPGGFTGLNVPIVYVNNGNTAESKLLKAIAAKYAPGTPTDDTGGADFGYIMVSDFQRAMTGITPTQFTSAGIKSALMNMKPQPMALLPGQKFQCNRQASTAEPAVCSNAAAIESISPTGQVTHIATFDASKYK